MEPSSGFMPHLTIAIMLYSSLRQQESFSESSKQTGSCCPRRVKRHRPESSARSQNKKEAHLKAGD